MTISAVRGPECCTAGRLALGPIVAALRILHGVEFYAPSVGGAQEVVRQVSERLAARGHDVTVATTALADRGFTELAGVKIAQFEARGNATLGMGGDVDAYRRFVADGGFDVVMVYSGQVWTTDALLGSLDKIGARTFLAPCGFSGLRNPRYADYYAGLREQLPGFDGVLVHSEEYFDAGFVRDAGFGERLALVPNAADEREFSELPERGAFRRRHGIGDDAPLLLTVGSHTGLKGHGAAMSVFRRLRGARGGTLAIVGNTPLGMGCRPRCEVSSRLGRVLRPDRRVLLLDPPRPEVLAAYADADLFVFASNVECSPIVLFEAMAAGLPFVSADVGNAAEIARWSGGGVVVPSRRDDDGLVEVDRDAMAKSVDDLLADPHRRAEMGRAARAAWHERFTWDAVATRYEAAYRG